jgi:mRNA-degrading endonuclease toxin of MazEF toxin-antitoxin module
VAIPDPEVGLVVHFNYLWAREARAGRDEARKSRPCAIVISFRRAADGARIALLAPITHSPPRDDKSAVEVPTSVKARLGLDEQRSWVIVDEVNETAWPGFDLRANIQGDYAYGFIPPRLHAKIKAAILDRLRVGRLNRIQR